MSKPIEVVAAILKFNNRVLIGKRMKGDSNAGKWEFPGGKVHVGESLENALRREILEELGIKLEGFVFFDHIQFEYPTYMVNIRFYLVDLHEPVNLVPTSHDELAWIAPKQYNEFDFLEANKMVLKKIADQM